MPNFIYSITYLKQVRIQRGGGGQGVRTPHGKSQVIWVSIGNKQLDPPGKVGPPPWKMLDPLWNLEKMIDFFEIDHFDFCKISLGLKKKKKKKRKRCQSFFCQIDLDPPPPDENSWIRACTTATLRTIGFQDQLWINAGQKREHSKRAFCNTFDFHLATICR